MPTYAIGDLQGCCDELESLLEKFSFDPTNDTLWLVGDLVNRGRQSLRTLRLIKSLGQSAVAVLGNHDLHLLAASCGVRKLSRNDTLNELLEVPDAGQLIDWLRHLPLAHQQTIGGQKFLMVHAGLAPSWTPSQAVEFGKEVQLALSDDDWTYVISDLFGDTPNRWEEELTGAERLRYIVNVLTRIRFCSAGGVLDLTANQSPDSAPPGFAAWFDLRHEEERDGIIITGHWSALGLRVGSSHLSIDTGCVWGGALTAVRLEDRKLFQTDCDRYRVAKDGL